MMREIVEAVKQVLPSAVARPGGVLPMRWLSFGAKTVARTFYAQFASEDGGGRITSVTRSTSPTAPGWRSGSLASAASWKGSLANAD